MEMKRSKREEVRRNEERVLREAEERRRKTVPEEVKQEKREERDRKTDKMRPHLGNENAFFVAAIIPPEKRPNKRPNIIREEIGSIAFEANLDIITKDEASALQSAESKLFGGLNPKDGIAAVALSAADMNEKIDNRELENVQGMFISMEYEPEESREEGKPRLYRKKGRKPKETTTKEKKEEEASKRQQGESVDDVEKMRLETEGMQIKEKQRESRQDARQNVPQTGRSE